MLPKLKFAVNRGIQRHRLILETLHDVHKVSHYVSTTPIRSQFTYTTAGLVNSAENDYVNHTSFRTDGNQNVPWAAMTALTALFGAGEFVCASAESSQDSNLKSNRDSGSSVGSRQSNSTESNENGNGEGVDQMPDMMLFCGNANPELAGEIASMLRKQLGDIKVSRFADGEVNVAVGENVRGKDVFIIQPTCTPVNEHLIELLLMVSTFRRASADKITAVIPYYGYARQDRKMTARVPISAADTARLLEAMGVDRVVAVDLHCGQIQGFFGPRVPVDNLDGGTVGVSYFSQKDLVNPVIISPDAGGVYRAKQFREGLNQVANVDAGLAMIIKQRPKAGQIERMDLVGSVEGSDCIIVDDMIDTAGTLCSAADMLKAHGARRVYAYASHGLFSGPANERIMRSALQEVVVVNTIPLNTSARGNPKIKQLSVAQLLAEAIHRVHKKESVSALFKEKPRSNWHSAEGKVVP